MIPRTCVVVLLFFACSSTAQRGGDAEAIRAAHRDLIDAVNRGDVDRAFRNLAGDFVGIIENTPNLTKEQYASSRTSWRAVAIWRRDGEAWRVARYIRTPDPPAR